MKRLRACRIIYLLIAFTLVFSQSTFASIAPKTFDSPVLSPTVAPAEATPSVFTSPLPTPTPDPSDTPPIVATSTPFPTEAPSVTPMPTPEIDPDERAALVMSIETDMWQAEAGDVLTYTVSIANRSSQALLNLQINNDLPVGLTYVARSASAFSYLPDEKRFAWLVDQIEPGQYLTGAYAVRVQHLAAGTVVTNTLTAREPASETTTSAATAIEVISQTSDDIWTSPAAAARLHSRDRRVALSIPAQAVARPTHISYHTQGNPVNPMPGLRFAFTLDAQDEFGQPLHAFDVPLDLAVHYKLKEFQGASSGQIALFYYNEAENRWLRIPSTIDTARHVIRASVNHFTLFAAALDSEEPQRMKGFTTPSVLGLQTSLWTGDSSFSYPLELPAAPGGNTPTLALAYSSGAANQMLALDPHKRMAQASDYGLGWVGIYKAGGRSRAIIGTGISSNSRAAATG